MQNHTYNVLNILNIMQFLIGFQAYSQERIILLLIK